MKQCFTAIGESGNLRASFRVAAERELIAEAIAVITNTISLSDVV